ncbi:MAG: FAD-binding oxidoreductase [Desulfovibrio sp.]|nr:FAD-binding oxidoreductase [Desulfovibrio sp.]
MADFLRELRDVVGEENFFDSRAEMIARTLRPHFGEKRPLPTLPEACVRPVNLAQAPEIFKLCREHGREINIIGGATRPFRFLPSGKWIVLTTSALSRILDLDKSAGLVSLQAGVSWSALNKALAGEGLRFPPVSARAPTGSVGGAIAANARTFASLKYGGIGGFVSELEIIDGSSIRFLCSGQNGQPGKLAPSFPLAPLFCGSLGCLGLIGAAVLRALPAPEKTAVLAASFAKDTETVEAAARLICLAYPPEKLSVAGRSASALLRDGEDRATLLLAYAGAAAEVGRATAEARQVLKSCGALEIKAVNEDPLAPGLPAALGKLESPFRVATLVAPPSSMPSAVKALENISAGNGVRLLFYGEPEKLTVIFAGENAPKAVQALFQLELILNKRLRSEEARTLSRLEWQRQFDAVAKITADIRKIFDPSGRFAGAPAPDAALPEAEPGL